MYKPDRLVDAVLLVDSQTLRLVATAPELLPDELGAVLSSTNQSLSDLFPQLTSEQLSESADEITAGRLGSFATTTQVALAGDRSELAEVTMTRLTGDENGQLLVLIRLVAGTTENASTRDALTGLPDRRALVAYHERWRRTPPDQVSPYGLLFLDLDDFKRVNDRFGHAAGDAALIGLASRWTACLRENDLVGRYGGDEFLVALARIGTAEEAQPVIRRLRQVASEPFEIEGQRVQLAVSVGVAIVADSGASLDEAIRAADRDMYREKKSPDS